MYLYIYLDQKFKKQNVYNQKEMKEYVLNFRKKWKKQKKKKNYKLRINFKSLKKNKDK